jgi:hypothetical protein
MFLYLSSLFKDLAMILAIRSVVRGYPVDSFSSENERFNINSFLPKSKKSTVLLGFFSWCALIECDCVIAPTSALVRSWLHIHSPIHDRALQGDLGRGGFARKCPSLMPV